MLRKILLILALLCAAPAAHAQNTTCATRAPGDSTNACASTAFVHGGFLPSTGWTPNNPLIGSSGGGVTQGTRQGTTTVFPVIDGTSINGQCAVFDSSGGFTSQPCATAGSGTVGAGLLYQFGYYNANGTSIVGTPLMETPQMRGATGNGSTDDTTAINNWLSDISSGHVCGFVPPGTYKFTTALTPITVSNWCIVGAGRYQSIFNYTGATTTGNLFYINCTSGSPCYDIGLSGFSITSSTVMTADSAMFLNYLDKSYIRDVNAGFWPEGNENLFNGITFANASFNTYNGGSVWSSNNGIVAYAGVELNLDNIDLVDVGVAAIYLQGGFGGLYLGYVTESGNAGTTQYGLLVGTTQTGTANAQIFISNRTAFDANSVAGIYLNDALAGPHEISMQGWSSSCSTNGCNGFAIVNWLNGTIQFGGGAQFVANSGNGIYIGDSTVHTSFDPSVLIQTSGNWGVFCNVTNNNVTSGATFITNVTGTIGTACHGVKLTTTAF